MIKNNCRVCQCIIIAIIGISSTAQSQIFDKVPSATYSARGHNPDYITYRNDTDSHAEYYNTVNQSKAIQHKTFFKPMLVIRSHYGGLWKPIWITSHSHVPRYFLTNLLPPVPSRLLGGGTPNYALKFYPPH